MDKEPLRDGLTIEMGWSILRLKRRKRHELHIYEPDFDTDPLTRLRDDVSVTLRVTASQNAFLNALHVPGQPVRFDQKIVVAQGVFELGHVYLERSGDVPSVDSGWFIGPVDEDIANLDAIYGYQLLSVRPEFVPTLILPAGYLVIFSGKAIESIVDDRDREIWQTESS